MRAYSTARRINSLFWMHRPSSVIATTPACAERTDRRQFFAHQAFRNRAGGQHVDACDFGRAIFDPGDRARTVRDRRRIRHANDGGESTRRRRARAGLDRLFPAEPRLAQMDVEVDQAGRDDEIGCVDLIDFEIPELRVAREDSESGRRRSARSATSSRLFAGSMIRPLRMTRVHGVEIPPQR